MNEVSSTPQSIMRLAFSGSTWTFIGFASGRALRLAGTLILTRILYPEAFGLMALVNAIILGLQMCSDIGIGASIVQNEKGNQPVFLHTAWTLQIARGVLLWCIALVVAPAAAALYDEPRLWIFISVASFSTILSGVNSTNWHIQRRELSVGRLTRIELISQFVSLFVMIACAYQWRSMWSLVVGGLVRALLTMTLTHILLGPPRMRFDLNRALAFEIFHFSKWIFLATLCTFVINQIDRLLLGNFISLEQLGVYSIAAILSQVTTEFASVISNRVLFPLYAKTLREDPDLLRARSLQLRRPLLLVTLVPSVVLVIWGPEIVNLLFDDRYASAGPILQILSVGSCASCLLSPMSSVALAVGASFRHLLIVASRSALVVGSMFAGGAIGGVTGMIVGLAVAPTLHYPILVLLVRRYNVWVPSLDIIAALLSVLTIGLGLWLK